MIRKNAISLIVTVVMALAILVGLPAMNVMGRDSGSHTNAVLADTIPTPTYSGSNPSGGGNGG